MKKKRMISLLLSVMLMLTLLPVTALAAGTWNGGMTAPTEGDGSSDEPYEIGTAEELAWFAAQVNGGNAGLHARLTDDIVLNNTAGWQNWGTSAPANTWTPIGNSSNRFAGTFDGAGHTVSGVYTVESGTTGFFGYVGVGTVKNVTVAASHIAGYDNVGGVCGMNYGGSFINCHNRGNVVAGGSYIGGIIGHNLKGTVTGCYNYGSVRGGTDVGGICGVSTGAESPGSLITGCGNAGAVTGTTKYVGGIAGGLSAATASSVIENSYNTGQVQGPQGTFQGGICGTSISGNTSNCYYLNTSSAAGIGNGSGPVSKTAAQFASGEVAYLLGAQFGQTLGPDGDTIPVPRASDNANQVFKLTYLNGAAVHAVQYYNSGSAVSAAGITAPVSGDGYFSGWEGLPATMPAHDTEVLAVFGEPVAPAITTESLPYAVKGVEYTAQIEATGTAPITFSVSAGSLPAGLTLNGTTGAISGTPTAAGTYAFTVRAANDSTDTPATREFSITVRTAPDITTTSLSDAYKGIEYTAQIEATGTTPIAYTVSAGSLPAGLTLNETTGVISGMPTAEGVSTFTVRAANSTGVQDTQELSITVLKTTPTITTGSLPTGVLGTPYSQTIAASGKTPITFSVSAGSLPAGLTLNGTTGAISGTPSAAGASTFTVQAANQAGTDEKELTITIEVQLTGNGTASNPYRIATAEHLRWFAQQVNGGRTDIHAIQVADIALNDTAGWENWGSAAPANAWTPIGTTTAYRFMGSFNGQNHTISGIYINSTGDYQGLFGYIGANTVVQNVRVTQSYIKGNNNVGGICGGMMLSTIKNCCNSGTVVALNSSAGGICGYVNTNNTIENCHNAGTVIGAGTTGPAAVGGISGSNSGTIKNCRNTGTVTSSNSSTQNQFGGVSGNNYGQIQHCYNTGAVNVPDKNNVGGFCGYNTATIQYCYNTGAVVGKSNVGSVCGFNGTSGNIGACYFLSPSAGIGNNMGTSTAEVRSAGAFASGEVAYLLGVQFGQTLGPDGDPTPVFRTADPSNAVYRLTYMNGDDVHATQYYNGGAAVSAQGITAPASPDGSFIRWEGLPETMPTGDVTVLAVFGSDNTPPAAKDPVPAQSMLAGDGASFDADDIAQDADGDDLTITAVQPPLDTGVATAGLQNDTVTVTGIAAGSTSVTVTVSDGTDTVNVVVPITVTARTYTLAWTVPAPDFAALTYGYSAGSSATFTVKNTGNSEVTGIAAAITAGSGSFEITTAISKSSLAPDETATVTVTSKTGLSAAGSQHTGTLTVTWSEGEGGTGIGRTLSQTVNKAAQAAPVASLFTVTDESVSGQNDGSIAGVTGAMEYRLGTSGDYISVPDGAAALTGLAPGGYSIRYKETGNYLPSPDTVVTVGEGAAPTYTLSWAVPAPDFAALTYGYAAGSSATFTVRNTGNSEVTGIAAAITAGSDSFEITTAINKTTLAPDETATVTVTSKTGLSAAGSPHTGTLTVTWSEGDGGTGIGRTLSQTVNKAAKAAPDASLFTVTDESVSGRDDGSIAGVTDAMEYRLGASGDYTAVPDGATTLTGLAPGEYSIRYQETDNYLASTATVVTVGEGAEPTYTLAWTVPAPDFAALTYGYAAGSSATFTVRNTGNSEVTGIAAAITAGSDSFEITTAINKTTLAPDETATVTVTSKTGLSAAGSPHTGTLTVTWSEGDGGTGIGRTLSQTVNKATQAAPDASLFTVTDESVSGQNDGSIAGVTDAMEYRLGASGDYIAVPHGATSLTGLAPGEYSIRYKETGNYLASPATVATVQEGAARTYTITAAPAQLNFGSVGERYSAPAGQKVVVTNTGNSPVTLQKPQSEKYNVTGAAFPVVLEAGHKLTLTVQPKTGLRDGTHDETIVFATEQGTSAAVSARFTVMGPVTAVKTIIKTVACIIRTIGSIFGW